MQISTLVFRDYKGIEFISPISQGQLEGTHINLFANDFIGRSAVDKVDLLAPCDMIVKSIATGDNTIFFESTEKVLTPSGEQYIWMMCTHIDDAIKNSYGLKVGKVINQGEAMYCEGVKGIGSGNHMHVECGFGRFGGGTKPYYKSSDTFVYGGKKYAQYYPVLSKGSTENSITEVFYLKDVELAPRPSTKKTLVDIYPTLKFVSSINQDKITNANLEGDIASYKQEIERLNNLLLVSEKALEEAKNELSKMSLDKERVKANCEEVSNNLKTLIEVLKVC